MKKNKKTLGAVITELREASLKTKSGMARYLSVAPQTVDRYERDNGVPETAMLWRLAVLAAAQDETQPLLPELCRRVAPDCMVTPLAAVVAAIIAQGHPGSEIDAATLRRIARRAAELLGEE